jgi:hypothetical protein
MLVVTNMLRSRLILIIYMRCCDGSSRRNQEIDWLYRNRSTAVEIVPEFNDLKGCFVCLTTITSENLSGLHGHVN